MALVASEQFEPFLDKNVVGNILDQVDQYQYLSLIHISEPTRRS